MSQHASTVDKWHSSSSETDDTGQQNSPTTTPSKRTRAKRFAKEATARGKDLLQPIINIKDVDQEENGEHLEDPAFNPGQILDGNPPHLRRESDDGIADRLKTAGNAIIHPRRAMRSKAMKTTAEKFSHGQRPYLSVKQDLEYLQAHEDLAKATSSASSANWASSVEDDSDIDVARKQLERLDDNRAALRTAWVLGRHTNRVRAVRRPTSPPNREDFVDHTGPKQQTRFAWERWLLFLLLYYTRGATAHYIDDFESPPFDMHDLIRNLERLSVVSAPWQAFFMDVRKIYMWQNPRRTGQWAALFWILWYTEHLGGFIFFYIIYMTLRNRYRPSSVESLRKTMIRNLDREEKAQAWGELIEKHGKNDWIEPLLAEIGPIVQMQLGDLAKFLEVLTNFYRWEVPNKTAASLFYFLVCLAITLLADMRYCVKIVTFILGGGFFVSFPLATLYPKQRYVFNMMRWPFWDIPDHAELGIIRLQEKVVLGDARARDEDVARQFYADNDNDTIDSDYHTPPSSPGPSPAELREPHLKFRVYVGKKSTQLTVTRQDFQLGRKDDKLHIPFFSLVEVRKVDIESKSNKLVTFQSDAEGLEIVYRDGDGSEESELSLTLRRNDRHKVFSHVLAWSGLKWQALQLERHNTSGDCEQRIDRSLERINM